MSPESAAAATIADADLDTLDAFMAFPAPLALLDTEGRTTLANTRFLQRFTPGSLDAAELRALAGDPDGRWRALRLPSGSAQHATVRVRAVRTTHRILLIVDEPDASAGVQDLDALRARIHELERLATTDHLTGAWNRAHLDRVIESELGRSHAIRQPLSLVLFDIDHFKQVNDRFGHAVGDTVLRELVRVARSRLRASDLLFRWGGEEFVVLVASAGYRRAQIVAENLRQAVADHVFEGTGRVTISLGVAEHDRDETPDAWFRRLDAALYEAKEGGRNRVAVSRRGNSDRWAVEAAASALHLVWLEGYECGEPSIDGEHRELFRLANLLIDASLPERPDAAAVDSALDALLAHVQRHFTDEEAILECLRYADLEAHRRAHAGLLRRATMLKDQVRSGAAKLGAVVEFLAQDVVARHLIAVDRAFFPLFEKAPAAAPVG